MLTKTKTLFMWLALVFITASLSPCFSILAQGTAFSYQGQLTVAGLPANGSYDMEFALFNAASGGAQVGGSVTNLATALTNGLFTVALDFGPTPYSGQPLWLQIAISPAGSNAYTALLPLQPLTSTPYAVQSLNAGTAKAVTGSISLGQLPSAVVTNGAANVSITGTFSGTFSGNGAGLSDVSLQPVSIAGTNVQAAPNTSYVVTNASQTVISLPASANVGDVVQVSATGEGGSVVVGYLPGVGTNFLEIAPWTQTTAPLRGWWSVASSSDGTHLVAASGNGYPGAIYTSTNSGATWTQTSAPSTNWQSVASSADGTHLVAACYLTIYTSTNGGSTWTQNNVVPYFYQAVASSSDGTHLVAAIYTGSIYTSTNGGGNWTGTSAPLETWQSVASSSDGTHLVAAINNGDIYTSTNSGGTWTLTSAPLEDWQSVASSSDGTHLIAAAQTAGVYTSTNGGGTWTLGNLPGEDWISVASSSDGTHLVAGAYGDIYTSTNSGATWTQSSAPSMNWRSVASSADGAHLVAVVPPGGIYTTPLGVVETAGTSQEYQYAGNGAWQLVTVPNPALPSTVALLNNNQTFSGKIAFSQAITVTNTVSASGISLYENGLPTSFSIRNGAGPIAELGVAAGNTQYSLNAKSNDVVLRASTGGTQQLLLQAGSGNANVIISNTTTSVQGTFNNNSDRDAKQDFAPVSPAEILDKVRRLPLSEWSYKMDAGTRHVGPMAQDFYAAFNVGTDDRHIAPIDEGGVALAAIQGTNQKLDADRRELEAENQRLAAEVNALKTQNDGLQKRLDALEKILKQN